MAIRGLIIAIESYASIQGFGNQLPGTTAAGVAFRDWLIRKKNAKPGHILFCTEDPAVQGRTSGASIQELIRALIDLHAAGKDNTEQLYVFFSGHGFLFDENPRTRAADVLLPSDFTSASDPAAGRLGLRLDEVQLKLQNAMGPGDHYYFVDACRNRLSEIDVAGTGLNFSRSVLGDPTVYTLYSTNRGAAAFLNSNFSGHLLAGLYGAGRAKAWRPAGDMEVTHSSLRNYVTEKLTGQEIDGGHQGNGRGLILEIRPAPQSKCSIQVDGARASDTFTLHLTDSRGRAIGGPQTFEGPSFHFSQPPDFYDLRLFHDGQPLTPESQTADLWDDCSVRFAMPEPQGPEFLGGPDRSLAPPPDDAFSGPGAPSKTWLEVAGRPATELIVEDLRSRRQERHNERFSMPCEAGRYRVRMVDSTGMTLRDQEVAIEAGERLELDFASRPESPVREAILSHLPPYAYDSRTVSFSESLGPLADDDLGLWLAIAGASRIVGPPGSYDKIEGLPLDRFEDVPPGGSVLYVLAGRDELEDLRVATDSSRAADWVETREVVAGVSGFRHARIDSGPGPLFLSLAAAGESPWTIASHCLPNRATLVIATASTRGGFRIQQYLLPLHHLRSALDPRVQDRLPQRNLLRRMKSFSLAQRQFGRRRDVESTIDPADWTDLLSGKWLDPVTAILAAYELLRRGKREHMGTVVNNLRAYFTGLADTEALARLAGEPPQRPASVPMVLDGLLSYEDYPELLPPDLPENRLDYSGPWTAWRRAVR